MDREQLKRTLEPFIRRCAEKGRPITDICLDEAFPGDNSTSYIVKVRAAWVNNMDCTGAIDFLFDTLWETTNENVRKNVFSIQVLDSSDQLHCVSEPVTE